MHRTVSWRYRTITVACFLMAAWFLMATYVVHAQKKSLVIPMTCAICQTRMSPDGKQAAVFENGIVVNAVASNPDMLAITIIETRTGHLVGRLTGQTDFTADAAFSPDGRWLASLHLNGVLRVWELKTRKLVWERQLPFDSRAVAFTPDGKTIVLTTGALPQMFFFVDLQSGVVQKMFRRHIATWAQYMAQTTEANNNLNYLYNEWKISPDGKQIVSVTPNDEVGVWDVVTGAYRQLRPPSEERAQFNIRHVGFMPDGGSIYFSVGDPGHLQIWNLATNTDTLKLDPDVTFGPDGLALSPDGKSVASVEGNERPIVLLAQISDMSQPQVVATLPTELNYQGSLVRVYFTPDGDRLIVGGAYAPDNKNALVIVPLEK